MKLSRRTLARHIGLVAGGAALAGPAAVHALVATPRQTEGPFYPRQLHAESDVDLTLLDGHTERAAGDVILVRGRVTDINGRPLANARVDIWHANHWGRYAHPADRNPAKLDPNFQGIGITRSDEEGRYGFRTIRPGAYRLAPDEEAPYRARHIHFKISHDDARDVTTQMYFEGDPLIETDIVMRHTPAEERHLLVTSPVEDPASGLPLHVFDIVLA